MFARLSNCAEESCASLSEHSKSRRMIGSKSSVTCGNFDSLRKVQDRSELHTRLCAGFCTVVAGGAFEFENNL
jgi:hypothetical protein